MSIVTQISVIIDNAPGTLKRICGALRQENINVRGFACWGAADHGIVRIICDKPLKALDLLEDAGMIALKRDVLEIQKANEPDALYGVAAMLESENINIDYAFGSSGTAQGSMFLGVSDPEAARRCLEKGG